MRRSLVLACFILLVFPLTASAQTPGGSPVFRLGFATLASLIPNVAGQPLENEHYGPNGDSLQQTTTGLMVWRKADNWTAFTNGYTTWINGPFGLQSRLNAERFPWEGNTPAPAPIATPPPLAPPAPPPQPAPSGQPMPVGDLPGWHQVFADDFTTDAPLGSFPGTAYGPRWWAYPDGWKDTSGNGTYLPSQVLSVSNGVLDYYIRTENGVHMVAAPVPKINGSSPYGQVYGRYAVRFRADSLHGYKNAWLLWPDSNSWPADGEIDFPEGNLDDGIHAFSHFANPGGGQEFFTAGAGPSQWHTAVTEWLPGKVTFYLDGRLIGSSTNQVASKPMHWVLQTETTIDGYTPADSVAGHVQIDWVAAWVPQ